MKATVTILAILLAATALAQPMYDPQGERHETPPTKVGDTHNVTPEMLVADGWTYESEEQAEDYAAQLAQQAAASEAARIAEMVQAYAPMVGLLNSNLDKVGWGLPCNAQAVTSDLLNRAGHATLSAEQRDAMDDIFKLYVLLKDEGVTDSDIAAIWKEINQGE